MAGYCINYKYLITNLFIKIFFLINPDKKLIYIKILYQFLYIFTIGMVIFPLPEIDNQIINLLHIGELLKLTECHKVSHIKITNSMVYKSAKQFYGSPELIEYKNSNKSVVQQYFLAACRQGKFEIIRYLFEKYNFSNILELGYEEILKTNNIKLINQYCQIFGYQDSPNPDMRWFLFPAVIDYIYGPNYLSCNLENFKNAIQSSNWELTSYIYNRLEKSTVNNKYIYWLIYNNITIDRVKWLINNCKIDISINYYYGGYPYILLYYNYKYNSRTNLIPVEKFLLIFGIIIFEDKDPSLLSQLIPIKNQIDQHIINNCITDARIWLKWKLVIYLINNFCVGNRCLNYMWVFHYCEPELLDCFLEKIGPNISELTQEPLIIELCYNQPLTEILISKKLLSKIKFPEDIFNHALTANNHQMLKFILENKKLDISRIKYISRIRNPKILEYFLEIGLLNFKDIKKYFIKDIFASYIYKTELLPIVLKEIKKAGYNMGRYDISYLFYLACAVSKNQAKLVYDYYKNSIILNTEQIIWLGIKY